MLFGNWKLCILDFFLCFQGIFYYWGGGSTLEALELIYPDDALKITSGITSENQAI